MQVLHQFRRFAGHLNNRLRAQIELWGITDRGQRVQRDLLGLADSYPEPAAAIVKAASGTASPAEQTWIQRIEELRRQMNASSELLEVMDYGAVSSNVPLSEDEMYAGRMIRRTVGQICRVGSKANRAQLLFHLVREVRPLTCIELGTSVGLSACYQAAALKLNGAGKLVTLEGADAVASVAARNFSSLGLDNIELVRGRFQDTLTGVLRAHTSVDYAFVDGHHDEVATMKYFSAIIPALAPNAVIVFDDIRWSEGMNRAWNVIQHDSHVRVSVDLGCMGLVSTGGAGSPQHFHTRF